MRKPTWLEIRTKIENDLDLIEENFITQVELLGYANEAIDECEAEIHSIHPEYFKTSANLALVSGTADYSLPSDIYANKILGVYYTNGATKYRVRRIRDIDELQFIQAGEPYRFELLNSSASGQQIRICPTPTETSSTNITLWYIRNAKRLALTTDECDIPEFVNFIFKHIKKSCLAKEMGGQAPQGAVMELDFERKLMLETLGEMVPDRENEILADFSFYNEFDSSF